MDIQERFNTRGLPGNIYARLANRHQDEAIRGTRQYAHLLYGKANELHERRRDEIQQYGNTKANHSYHRKTAWNLLERQNQIRQQGLRAKLYFHEDFTRDPANPFYSIRVQPITGFIDTDSVGYGKMRNSQHPDRPHPYHISIGNLRSFQDNPAHMRQLEHLRRRYAEPFEYNLYIDRFGGGNTAEIHPNDRIYRDVVDLYHADARARNVRHTPTPHVSMI